jgi:hypothetical protein
MTRPNTIPDADKPPAPILPGIGNSPSHRFRPTHQIIAPCPNISVFYIQVHHWLHGGAKSLNSRESLCNDVIQKPDFNSRDTIGVNFRALDKELANMAKNWDPSCPPSEGWKKVTIQLEVPPVRQTQANSSKGKAVPPKIYINISGLYLRKLTDIIRKAFSSNNVPTFHYEPFECYWIPPGSTSRIRLCGEMFWSPKMINAHREVQKLVISDKDCMRPRCIAAWMFSSDAMQFGNFCNAKGWPIYGYFGNESKYERCKPSSNSCYVVAHIPVASDFAVPNRKYVELTGIVSI